MSSDIEQARAARAIKLEHAGAHEAVRIATGIVEQLGPDSKADLESVALMIAVIAVCDAFGISRETMIGTFTNLAQNLAYPAAVLE